MLDRLLHAHRSGQRPRRRRIHHHQAVTEILDLGPARRRDRTPQQAEMLLTKLLRAGRTQPRPDRGRVHEIREHERRRHRRRQLTTRHSLKEHRAVSLTLRQALPTLHGAARHSRHETGGSEHAPLSQNALPERRSRGIPERLIYG